MWRCLPRLPHTAVMHRSRRSHIPGGILQGSPPAASATTNEVGSASLSIYMASPATCAARWLPTAMT